MNRTWPGIALAALLLACGGGQPSLSNEWGPAPSGDVAAGLDDTAAGVDLGPRDDGVAVDLGPGTDPGTGEDLVPPADHPIGETGGDEGPDAFDEGGSDAADVVLPDEVDVTPPVCEGGTARNVACGLNGRGSLPQSCVEGAWQDAGPCQDPDACGDGTTQDSPCGLNGRGTRTDACVAGQWTVGPCQDPDACVDGAEQVGSCGKGGAGSQRQACAAGQWTGKGPCIQPGRWRCVQNECTPLFGDKSCGDGACDAQAGESPWSCPQDCAVYTTAKGQGQDCNNVLDCIFYPWPANGPGYWECAGFITTHCNAVQTTQYCGTQGYDYCYLTYGAAETPTSCPQDCASPGVNCGSDAECVFLPWPTP